MRIKSKLSILKESSIANINNSAETERIGIHENKIARIHKNDHTLSIITKNRVVPKVRTNVSYLFLTTDRHAEKTVHGIKKAFQVKPIFDSKRVKLRKNFLKFNNND